MPAPIELSVSHFVDLLSSEHNPQHEALIAKTYDEFKLAMRTMKCTCCPIGPTNCGAPPVFEHSNANIRGRILMIGEAPGVEERIHGECFVGDAGQKLRALLSDAGLPPQAFYLANVAKCRPFDNIQDAHDPTKVNTKDHPPSPEEARACLP